MHRATTLSAVLAAAAVAAAPAAADAVEDVIRSQIDAFLQDDVAAAFTFASPAIRGIFGTPEAFGRMVREGYPMVWRPADLRFLEQEERPGRILQSVMIEDQGGRVHILEYEMIRLDDGWRINGVRILAAARPLA